MHWSGHERGPDPLFGQGTVLEYVQRRQEICRGDFEHNQYTVVLNLLITQVINQFLIYATDLRSIILLFKICAAEALAQTTQWSSASSPKPPVRTGNVENLTSLFLFPNPGQATVKCFQGVQTLRPYSVICFLYVGWKSRCLESGVFKYCPVCTQLYTN